jgi:hypothetical protein
MPRSTFLLAALAAFAALPLQANSLYYEDCEAMTGNSATLIVPAAALEASPVSIAAGSEFALFTPAGICAGHAVWEGGALAIAVWQDDPQTGHQDGFVNGEALRLAVWNPASATEHDDLPATLDPAYTEQPVFASDAVYLVSALGATTGSGPDEPAFAFGLEPNYPNPFVDATTIRYAVPNETDVKVSVYNLLGQRVAELVNERQQPGSYEVTFRPPATLTSGTYLYRLVTDTYAENHRMVFVR